MRHTKAYPEGYCIFCKHELKYKYAGGAYLYYKCRFCNLSYMRHRNIEEWCYLENRRWTKNYGNWVVCTKQVEEGRPVRMVFT